MEDGLAERILTATYTYRIETRNADHDWAHTHPPAWETTEDYPDAHRYARTVRRDQPDTEVRIRESAEGLDDNIIPIP